MDHRRSAPIWLAGTVCLCLLAAQPHSTDAQTRPRPPQRQQQPAPGKRPVGQPLKVETPSDEVMKILYDWERASGKFEKLQGDHTRWVYDFVFNVEKRSKGKFWYANPDKGRIDLDPWNNTSSPRTVGKNGRPLPGGKPFAVQPDDEDKWISNGKQIVQVNSAKKTIDVFPIPKAAQGAGITDSPLPFLFGMKAKKAARRYQLKVGRFNNPKKGHIHLIARPYLIQDARNWSKAEIMLNAKTFYPTAIKLIDPGANSETVYKFTNVGQPGLFQNVLGANPFQVPKKNGFKMVVHGLDRPNRQVAKANPQPSANRQMRMPQLAGRGDWKQVKEYFEGKGFAVKLRQGMPAPKKDLVYSIYQQSPAPGAPMKKSVPIVLTLYTKVSSRTSAKPARGTSSN